MSIFDCDCRFILLVNIVVPLINAIKHENYYGTAVPAITRRQYFRQRSALAYFQFNRVKCVIPRGEIYFVKYTSSDSQICNEKFNVKIMLPTFATNPFYVVLRSGNHKFDIWTAEMSKI